MSKLSEAMDYLTPAHSPEGHPVLQHEYEALCKQLAAVSEELGLPPTIGPAKGEIPRLLGDKNRRIAELEQQLADCQAELRDAYDAVDKNWVSHKQLAAAQADNLRLREALEKIADCDLYDYRSEPGQLCIGMAEAALATPPGDMTALREVIAQVMEQMGHKLSAKAIRAGYTPEALK